MLLLLALGACKPGYERGPVVPVVTDGSNALDVNDDGHGDLVLSRQSPGGSTDYGLYVFLGGPEGFDIEAPRFINLRRPGLGLGSYGSHIAWAGDLNGDGFADFSVTEQIANGSADTYVFLGGPEGPPDDPIVLPGTGEAGTSAGRIGDFDGDGFDDLFVHRFPDEFAIHLGGADGISDTSALRFHVDTLPESFPVPEDFNGWQKQFVSVASAGDVDGDGLADVFVRIDERNNPSVNHAKYVLHGGGTWSLADAELSALALEPQIHARLGDFDGNGHPDLVYQPGQSVGLDVALEVLWGSPDGVSGNQLITNRIDGEIAFEGRYPAPIGDVDADGYEDLAFQHGGGELFTQIFRGGPDGLATTPSAHVAVPEEDVFRYQAEDLTFYGIHARSLGDVDGDGFGDVAFHGGVNGVGGDTILVEYGGLQGLDGSRYQLVYLQSLWLGAQE